MADVRKAIIAGLIAIGVFGSMSHAAEVQKKLYNDCSSGKGPVCVQIPEVNINGKTIDVKLNHLNGGKVGALTLKLYKVSSTFPRVEGEKKVIQILNLVSTTKSISMGPLDKGSYQLEIFWENKEMRVQGHARTFDIFDEVMPEITPTPVPTVQPTANPEIKKLKDKLSAQEEEQKQLAQKLKQLEEEKNTPIVKIPEPVASLPWWEGAAIGPDIKLALAADLRGVLPYPDILWSSGFNSLSAGIGGKITVDNVFALRLLAGARYNYGYYGYGVVPIGTGEIEITPLDGLLKISARGDLYPALWGVRSEGFGGISVRPYAPVPLRIGVYGLVNPETWMIGAGPELDYTLKPINFNVKAIFGVSKYSTFSGAVIGEIKY